MDLSFILSPKFLVDNIETISLIIAGFLLIMFDSLVTGYALRFADAVKESTATKVREFGKKTNLKKVETFGTKLVSESLAAAVVLVYCYFGVIVLAHHVFAPILESLKSIITLVLVGIFLLISYVVNTKSVREAIREL